MTNYIERLDKDIQGYLAKYLPPQDQHNWTLACQGDNIVNWVDETIDEDLSQDWREDGRGDWEDDFDWDESWNRQTTWEDWGDY